MDPTVTERVVVVSSMGSTTDTGGAMGQPERRDGSLGRRHRHRELSLRAGQRLLRPDHRCSDVATWRSSPPTPSATGSRRSSRASSISTQAADQVAVAAVGIPSFVTAVQKVSADGLIGAGATAGPELVCRCDRPASAGHPKRGRPKRRSASGNSSPIRTPTGRSPRRRCWPRRRRRRSPTACRLSCTLRRTCLRPCGCCRRRFPG